MYRTDDILPADQLDPGAYILTGPAMSGKYDLLIDFVAAGVARDDGVLFVTTNQGAGRIIDDVDTRVERAAGGFRIVDTVSERQGAGAQYPTEWVEYVASPADLTGMGIGVSEQLGRLAGEYSDSTRVAFDSLSTLLMYSDLETVFRFMHVLTGRVAGIGGLGLFALDPTTHDRDTVNTIKQLFDGAVELRQGDGAGHEVRLVGVSGAPEDWVARP